MGMLEYIHLSKSKQFRFDLMLRELHDLSREKKYQHIESKERKLMSTYL